MRFTSRSRKAVDFLSAVWHESKTTPGVRFATRQVSLLQRIELTRRVQELAARNEFLNAGTPVEQIEAALADLLVRKLYVEWGLEAVEGFFIDGEPATPVLLIEKGPEVLAREIAAVIRADLTLSEDERKNS